MKKCLPVLALAALAFVPLSKGEQIEPSKISGYPRVQR